MLEQTSVTKQPDDSAENLEKSRSSIRAEVADLIQKTTVDIANGQYSLARGKATQALDLSREMGASAGRITL